jgi:molybdopterin-containing oxidoreductase family iron-sulfur binding subunit
VRFRPVLCQHCDAAPCEPVCPTYASHHTEEGLNAQVYNRCIGTRYCANACPYNVRFFDFFNPQWPKPLHLQLNPDVSVREVGVMEKCTFCVQRIEEAKIATHARVGASGGDLRIPRDSFTTACAQACPNEAIAFGDIKDPESKVSKWKGQDRNYRLLDYLNVNARTSYLARIRNPNPKMPEAKNIGVASPEEAKA